MTGAEIIYDTIEIKRALSDDKPIEESWLLYKINNYRSIFISQQYELNNEINPSWIQRLFKFNWIKTNAADDPAIELSSITLGKYTFPEVISLPNDMGIYRISGSGRIRQFEITDFNSLMIKAELEENQYGYCSRIGNVIYIYPYIMQGSALIIAENPFDIKINDNGTFRDMTLNDTYPLDSANAQKVILEILTKDLAISEQAITDLINDSQDQLKVFKDAARTNS